MPPSPHLTSRLMGDNGVIIDVLEATALATGPRLYERGRVRHPILRNGALQIRLRSLEFWLNAWLVGVRVRDRVK